VPLAAASTVERREAPHPYVIGVRVPRQARGGPRHGPQGTYVTGARRLPALHVPRSEGDGKRGKGEPGSPKSEVAGRRSVGYAGCLTSESVMEARICGGRTASTIRAVSHAGLTRVPMRRRSEVRSYELDSLRRFMDCRVTAHSASKTRVNANARRAKRRRP